MANSASKLILPPTGWWLAGRDRLLALNQLHEPIGRLHQFVFDRRILEATRLMTAELRIREFLAPAASSPVALRASLEELCNAANREAELRPREASFWQGIMDFIDQRLAMLDVD